MVLVLRKKFGPAADKRTTSQNLSAAVQLLIFFMVLWAARQANPQRSRRNELDGKRQRGVGRVLIGGKLIGFDRLDNGQHVVEGLPREILATRQAIIGTVFRWFFMTQVASIQSMMARPGVNVLSSESTTQRIGRFFDNSRGKTPGAYTARFYRIQFRP
jgi:hypothetical protein